MYRAAYPRCSDSQEKSECLYAKTHFDLAGNNGSAAEGNFSGIIRLAGTWVSLEQAKLFAVEYGIQPVVDILAAANPDPKVDGKKLGKTATPNATIAARMKASSTNDYTPSTKRRREEQIAVSPTVEAAKTSSTIPGVRTTRRSATPSQSRASLAAASKTVSPPPRRSSRKRSVPPPELPPATTTPKTAKLRRGGTPGKIGGSDQTLIEEEDEDGFAADVAAPNMLADIEEQHALIESLQRSQASGTKNLPPRSKRALEEEKVNIKQTFEPKEHSNDDIEMENDRQIATNRRIRAGVLAGPERKSFAWGVFVLAVGATAM